MNTSSQTFLSRPEDISTHFAKAWNHKDSVNLSSVFYGDTEFINVTDLLWHSRADIQQARDSGFRVILPDSELTVLEARTKRISDSAAVVHAKMKLTGQKSINRKKAPVRRTIFPFVLHKNSEGWACVSAHNTDIVPRTKPISLKMACSNRLCIAELVVKKCIECSHKSNPLEFDRTGRIIIL